MKKCKRCHVPKDLSEFNKDCHTADGLSNKCRQCINAPTQKQADEKALFNLRNDFFMGKM